MKIRNGFVSNSSSSSFAIRRTDLTANQYGDLIRYKERCGGTGWNIMTCANFIIGETTAMSFDMEKYLNNLGISPSHIIWAND